MKIDKFKCRISIWAKVKDKISKLDDSIITTTTLDTKEIIKNLKNEIPDIYNVSVNSFELIR